MRWGKGDGEAGDDRYDELMQRHDALQRAVQQRMRQHVEAALEQQPLSGVAGSSTRGITLAADGTLYAELELTHPGGRAETVRLQAIPGRAPEKVTATEPQDDVPRTPVATRDETAERIATVRALAERHLPPAAAEEFLGWLRPALRLQRAGGGDPVVAQLGGLPTLPINTWPVWEGHGPLSHVLTLDCPEVKRLLPELPLPEVGTLAFFYYDGRYLDDQLTTVGSWDPTTHAGARVLHLRPDLSTPAHLTDALTPAPPGLDPYPTVALTAVRTVTWPSGELPWVGQAWERHGLTGDASSPVDALMDELWELPGAGYDTHQVGGHATPQQGAVELEVEQFRRGVAGTPFDWSDPDVQASATHWQLLLQVASDDADMMWGDVGQLYWLIRDADPPTAARFTWQCG
ncbi:MAG: DUF1963 domain-containing protein [Nocardioides sp.]